MGVLISLEWAKGVTSHQKIVYKGPGRWRDHHHTSNSLTVKSSEVLQLPTTELKMDSKFAKIIVLAVVAVMVAGILNSVDATYRKPPFNGSIFGKRGTSQEYDTAGKALSAMCEIASEACQAWFPPQEK